MYDAFPEMIRIADVRTDNSIFTLERYVFESPPPSFCSAHDFSSPGILLPIIVVRDHGGQLHLVDGRRRILHAQQSGAEEIPAAILPASTPLSDILIFILCSKRYEIFPGIINCVQFLCFAMDLGADESWILSKLCRAFGFRPHASFLRDCKRVQVLPLPLRQFCHEKIFSLKQILNLTFFPDDLIDLLVHWISCLPLTASTFEEIAAHLRAYLRREGMSAEDFVNSPDVQDIFSSSMSPRAKTEKLRGLIRRRQLPVLTAANDRIAKTVHALGLPKDISLQWDKTLENREIRLSVTLRRADDWSETVQHLSSPELAAAMKTILEEL